MLRCLTRHARLFTRVADDLRGKVSTALVRLYHRDIPVYDPLVLG